MRGLPTLPKGWSYETWDNVNDIVFVCWPGHGAVSVHLTYRQIKTGWIVNFVNNNDPLVTGRHWKRRLIELAIAILRKEWE